MNKSESRFKMWMRSVLWMWAAWLFTIPGDSQAAFTSGAAFLKIDTGARPAAMGGAYTALADDVNALYYNPAGLASLKMREIGATHTQWLLDSQFDFIGYAQPTMLGTLGIGATRLASGNADSRDANRQSVGGFSASDTAYTLGFSHAFGPGGAKFMDSGTTNLGVSVKLLQSQIGAYSASAVAFDMGATHQLESHPLSFGIAILNMGDGIRFLDQTDPLPLSMTLGAAYRLGGLLNLAVDVRREVYDERTDIGVGTEYAFFSGFLLRAGYASIAAQGPTAGTGGTSALTGLSGGMGLRFSNYRMDYTFAPFGTLGNIQRISVGARF